MWFWLMNRVWDSGIYQTTHLEALFYFSDQIFPLWAVGCQCFLGFYSSKGQFMQCFKPVTKLFWKLEWELWICSIKSKVFFRLASILLLWFHGYRSRFFLRFIFVTIPSRNYSFPLGVHIDFLMGEFKRLSL